MAIFVLRTGHRLYGRLLSLSWPFCVSIPRYFSLGLEDSENVCSDCRWCYCANIDHKCKRRWGCFGVLLSSSPPLFTLLLFLFPVFLTFPTLAVPVHSIRLDYGCVVVDTCSLWSVSQCCRVRICCSLWCHRTRSSDRISGDKRWKGWPRFPKKNKKNIGSHFTPYTHSWKSTSGTFPVLLSAALRSFSGYENPRTVLYVFSLMITCHTLTCKCRKGGWVVLLTPWLWAYTHFLPTVVHWVILWKKQPIYWKQTFSCWSRVKISACIYSPHKSLKARRCFPVPSSFNFLPENHYLRLYETKKYVKHFNWKTLPNNCSALFFLKKVPVHTALQPSHCSSLADRLCVCRYQWSLNLIHLFCRDTWESRLSHPLLPPPVRPCLGLVYCSLDAPFTAAATSLPSTGELFKDADQN